MYTSNMTQKSFTEKVLRVVAKIPKGKVLTYKQVAEKAGSTGAARAVGSIMKNNQNKQIPCHRVVTSTGKVGDYNNLQGKDKRKLLEKEGMKFSLSGKIIHK